MTEIVIMLGGNLPGSAEAMRAALKKFSLAGITNITAGKIRSSVPVDCVPGTPDFLDMAFCGKWGGSAAELLKLCQEIEQQAGRPAKHSSRESRILDCDIIFFGNEVIEQPDLVIPHPRAQQRGFVLEALNDIVPKKLFPNGKSVEQSLSEL